MKFRITFKTPDVAIDSAIQALDDSGYCKLDIPAPVSDVISKFIKWDEYVTIELDSETQTARVVPV